MKYKFFCIETIGGKYRYSFGKLCDNNTLVRETVTPENGGSGIWIDIFPIDGLGSEKNVKKQAEKIYKNGKRINFFGTADRYGLKGKILKTIGRKNINRYLRFISKKHSFDQSKFVSSLMLVSTKPVIWKKEWFDETLELPFENEMFPVPGKFHELLQADYGDYMQFPPEEERKPGHAFEAYFKEE